MIIFVFHESKPETANYYQTLWSDAPPVPVVFVGNNVVMTNMAPLNRPNRDLLGLRLPKTLVDGTVCAYFPVSYADKRTCKELLNFLSLGSWPMRKGPEHAA